MGLQCSTKTRDRGKQVVSTGREPVSMGGRGEVEGFLKDKGKGGSKCRKKTYLPGGKKPVVDTKKPTVDTKKPTVDTKKPTVDTKKPTVDTKKPTVVDTPVTSSSSTNRISSLKTLTINSSVVPDTPEEPVGPKPTPGLRSVPEKNPEEKTFGVESSRRKRRGGS